MTLIHLQIALQGYLDLAPAFNLANNNQVSDQVERWLTKEVSPLVEELGELEWFRSATLWSGMHLSAEFDTPERKTVETVETELLGTARALSRFIEQAEAEMTSEQRDASNIANLPRERIDYIASKPWYDLVREQDFLFGTLQNLYLDPDKIDNEYVLAFRKRDTQFPLGDYISRLLLTRVGFWKGILKGIVKSATTAIPAGVAESQRSLVLSSARALDAATEVLQEVCTDPSVRRLREACTTLTLVHAAYDPNPRLPWLEVLLPNESHWNAGGKMLRRWIRRGGTVQSADPRPGGMVGLTDPQKAYLCDPVIIRKIAWSLEELITFCGVPDNAQELIRQAKLKAKLVLVDRENREVWFEGAEACDHVWNDHARSWDLLWKLALHTGNVVDHELLAGTTQPNFRIRRNRLGNLLGVDSKLDAQIETIRGLGYKLDFPKTDVVLLRDEGDGVLKEVTRSQ
jgi:hypothetical protein